METDFLPPFVHVTESPGADALVPFLCDSGYYCVVLCREALQHPIYGWQSLDYTDGTVLFYAPTFMIGSHSLWVVRQPIRLVAFHAEWLQGTTLKAEMSRYTFFRYRLTEALHVSQRERQIIDDCMKAIDTETKTLSDAHHQHLLAIRIGLLLDYGLRFYERQFMTRYLSGREILHRYEMWVKDCIAAHGIGVEEGLFGRFCSERLGVSEAYLEDLLKMETGLSPTQYVYRQGILRAQQLLRETRIPVSRIAFDLGFPSTRDFTVFFMKTVGCSPDQFRFSC